MKGGYNRPPKRAVELMDGGGLDAFGRLRVSEPFTVFDSQMQYNTLPLFWESALTGAGTATHLPNESSVRMSVTDADNDMVVRQTKRYFRYQPGKSQRILMTFVLGAAKAGVRRRVGYFDTQNGIFLEQTIDGLYLVRRSYATGTAVDTRVEQADWNIDNLDETGANVLLDSSKAQILLIDLEWLGVGRVRCGFVIDGIPRYVHEFNHANIVSTVYMTTANLPLRYEIENTAATTGASHLIQICAEVSSEGGVQEKNLTFGYTMVAGRSVTNTPMPVLSITVDTVLPSGGTIVNRETVEPLSYGLYTEDAAIAYWLVLNGTLTNPSWVAVDTTNSGVKYDISATAISGGVQIGGGGFIAATQQSRQTVSNEIVSKLLMSTNVAGNAGDILSLMAVRLTSTSSDTWASMTWKELY